MFPSLATPALLLDAEVFGRNVRRGVARAVALGVGLRPHAKTVKSPELLGQVMELGARGLTVSTLGEIRTLKATAPDLMYAVPVAAGKDTPLLRAMGDDDIAVTVIIDDVANLDGIPRDPRIRVAIEIDSDGHRGGMEPTSGHLVELAERIGERSAFAGVMTHGGGSYLVEPGEVKVVAAAERQAVLDAAARLTESGIACPLVSVGSTPTFFAVDHLDGVTEARPGVYLFGDRSTRVLGACSPDQIAVSVLATVVGQAKGGTISFLDAGWSALSQDRGVPALGDDAGLGAVVDGAGDDALVVIDANQEHGFVARRGGGPTGLATGSRVAVIPNHACATAELHREIVVVSGESVLGRIERPRGW